jgi:16S rRNA (guanine527-N7)-methyltransferase
MEKKEMMEKYLKEAYPACVNDTVIEKFLLYLDQLKEWNEKFNLTSITDDKEVIIKHFADSLVLVKPNISMSWQTIVDIGAGAGLPGIPLAIVFPDKKIYLNDSNGKKVQFLKHMKEILSLSNLEILESRAETISHAGKYREFFDAAVMRALASFPIALELSAGFVKPGGYIMYYASSKQAAEINKKMKCFEELGCSLEGSYAYELAGGFGSHAIVSVKKLWKTPVKYPRVFGSIKKKPL